MPDWRPIEDLNTSSKTNMPDQRPTCLSGDQSEIDMPHRRPIRNTYLAQGQSPIRYICSGMRHVGLHWVSDEACRSLTGLQSGISVSDWSLIRHVGLRWVSDRSLMGL